MKIIATILPIMSVLAILTSCNSSPSTSETSPTKTFETAVSITWTKVAETQMAVPAATLFVSPSPLPFIETPMPKTQPSPIPASSIPTMVSFDNGLTWTECVLPRRDYAYSTDMEFVTNCLQREQPHRDDTDKIIYGERIQGELGDNLRMTIGDDIYETSFSRGGTADYELLKNGIVIAKTSASLFSTFDPNMNLLDVGGKAVWEVANPSVIIVNSLNQNEKYQFEETYFPYVIKNKLIYIAKKNGKYNIVYDEQLIGPEFDWIYLGYCCGNTNVLRGAGQYWFWGRREGMSFVVAIQ